MNRLTYYSQIILLLLIVEIISIFIFPHYRNQHIRVVQAQEEAVATEEEKDEEVKTQEEKIQDLKDRLATKVAEIRESQRGALSGTITELDDDTLVLVTKSAEFSVNFNEDDTTIEELVSGRLRNREIDDLDDDLYVTIFGLVNEDAEEIDASRIVMKQQVITLTGIVTEKDSKNFTVNVQTTNNELFIIDFESSTSTVIWDEEDIVKSGYSDVAAGDRIHVRAIVHETEEKRVTATRVLHLPDSLFEDSEVLDVAEEDEEIPEVEEE